MAVDRAPAKDAGGVMDRVPAKDGVAAKDAVKAVVRAEAWARAGVAVEAKVMA
jgi:hypothetical protein